MTAHLPYRVVLRIAKTLVQDFEANLELEKQRKSST